MHNMPLDGITHEHTAAIDLAAAYLVETPIHARPQPLIPALRSRFGLTPLEACQAIRDSRAMTGGGDAMSK